MVLSESVIRFIRDHIHSVEQLEILLLLQSDENREWAAEEVNKLLKSDKTSVEARLNDLYSRNLLLKREGGTETLFKFSDDPLTKLSVEEIRNSYKVFPVRMIETIYLRKNESLDAFAASFRIRKS